VNNWKETTLGEVVEFQRGFDLPVQNRTHGEYPLIVSNGIEGFVNEYKVNGPGVITGRSGTLGKVFFVKENYWPLNTTLWIKDFKGNDERFIYYWLLNFPFEKFNAGSGVPTLNRNHIHPAPVTIPESIKEQKVIAANLSSFDDKIELLRRQNKTLGSIARTIFKEWFVNFTVNGQKLKVNSKTGMPDGWTQKGLGEIADFLNGLALQKYPPKNETDVLPVIKIRELKAGITEQTDKASKQIDPEYIVDNGDVIFSWSGSLDVVLWCYGKGALNQHLFKVTSKKCPKWFYYYWTIEHLPFFKSIAKAKATTMGHIQRHHLAEALVAIPDDDFMAFADGKIKPIFEHIILNNSQIQTLSNLRDALLPKLMKGEIRVKL
jgi:type I restriction enzyme S subunit